MARRNSVPSNPQPDTAPLPALRIVDRQRAHRLDLSRIRRIANAALPHCLAQTGDLPPDLPALAEVEISLLGPRAMSRVHVDFLGIPGPTDVITFPYGEILACPAIAAENCREFSESLDDEVALYIIHGLLHLNGFDDTTPAAARRMHARQAKILNLARKSG